VIPGKLYKPEDYLEMAWRRRWYLIVPLVVFSIGTFIYSQTLPNRYRSEALVLVMAPQVPEDYVRSVETATLQQRLGAMQAIILSRPRLERIVQEFNIYPEERSYMLMDQVLEQMRRDISVVPAKAARKQDPGSFTVSFDHTDPRVAQQVAARLASLFVRENVENRHITAQSTNQFLQREVDESLRRLKAQEASIEEFRQRNIGRLPDEVQSNLAMIQNTRQQIQALSDANNRDRERQITIDRTIADEIAIGNIAAASGLAAPGSSGASAVPQTAGQELASVTAALDRMLLRLKEDHPDVRAARRRIAELEARVASEALTQPLSADAGPVGMMPGDVARAKRISGLRIEFDQLERNIQARNGQVAKLQAEADDYRRRVEAAPALESELSQLMRGYQTMKTTHESLLRRAQDAQVAVNLEERQVTQQFRILDDPRVPERPRSPDRVRMNLIGALLGLGLGAAVAFLLEYRDTSLRSEEDVLIALSLPVVATVPTMSTAVERQAARRRRMLLVGSSAVVTLVISAAALVWKLRLLDSWIR
jgi:polysaccharide chain length determinant protein (PEP-CTERM system associated)